MSSLRNKVEYGFIHAICNIITELPIAIIIGIIVILKEFTILYLKKWNILNNKS